MKIVFACWTIAVMAVNNSGPGFTCRCDDRDVPHGKEHRSKVDQLVANMHWFQLAVEDFSTMAEGQYPANLDVQIRDLVQQDCAQAECTVTDLCRALVNPYFPREPAITGFVSDTSVWLPLYRGKVVYFPTHIHKKGARGYVIKGSTPEGYIDKTLSTE